MYATYYIEQFTLTAHLKQSVKKLAQSHIVCEWVYILSESYINQCRGGRCQRGGHRPRLQVSCPMWRGTDWDNISDMGHFLGRPGRVNKKKGFFLQQLSIRPRTHVPPPQSVFEYGGRWSIFNHFNDSIYLSI